MKTSILILAFFPCELFFAQSAYQDTISDKAALSFEISCDKSEFIQGEPINILAKIKNNTNDTIITHVVRYYLHNLSKDSIYKGESNYRSIINPPHGKYYYFHSPADFIVYGKDWTNHFLYPGNYEYYISSDNREFVSNKIYIKVIPIPDSLKQAFNELKYVRGKLKTIEDYKSLAEKYKGTIYEEVFLNILLGSHKFRLAIQNKDEDKEFRDNALNLYKEFILKFSNTKESYRLFENLMYNYLDNKKYIESIIKTMTSNQPDCKLLEVLRNQPDYINKQIKYLLK